MDFVRRFYRKHVIYDHKPPFRLIPGSWSRPYQPDVAWHGLEYPSAAFPPRLGTKTVDLVGLHYSPGGLHWARLVSADYSCPVRNPPFERRFYGHLDDIRQANHDFGASEHSHYVFLNS